MVFLITCNVKCHIMCYRFPFIRETQNIQFSLWCNDNANFHIRFSAVRLLLIMLHYLLLFQKQIKILGFSTCQDGYGKRNQRNAHT